VVGQDLSEVPAVVMVISTQLLGLKDVAKDSFFIELKPLVVEPAGDVSQEKALKVEV
jgi:hypothetical protein